MKKRLYVTVVIFICSVISVFPVSADTAITQSLSESKTLVAYYSASGTTDRIAQFIAEEMNADTFVITPVDEYTDADLDWTDSSSRVVTEHNDPNRHTELVTVMPESFDNYDNIFIGYPIWWQEAAWVVNVFVMENDFTGKNVIPFCTSMSSPLGESGTKLAAMAGTGNWLEGMQFTSYSSQEQVQEWVNSLDLFKPDIHRGDVNGDGNVNAGDAAFIAKKLAEASISGEEITVEKYPYADFNNNGKISAQDAAMIAKWVAEQALKK